MRMIEKLETNKVILERNKTIAMWHIQLEEDLKILGFSKDKINECWIKMCEHYNIII